MKVAVAATGPNLDAALDPRFGRCGYFVIVDTDSMEFETLENSGAIRGSGAGIAAAQLVVNAGAEAVIAGNFGPHAFQALSAGGLQLYSGGSGSVRETVAAGGIRRRPGLAGPAEGLGESGLGAGWEDGMRESHLQGSFSFRLMSLEYRLRDLVRPPSTRAPATMAASGGCPAAP